MRLIVVVVLSSALAVLVSSGFRQAAVRLDAFPAQFVCTDEAGRLVTDGAFKECYRAHVVPADR